jgi:hypothetical protein
MFLWTARQLRVQKNIPISMYRAASSLRLLLADHSQKLARMMLALTYVLTETEVRSDTK